jgi:Putative Ig domain
MCRYEKDVKIVKAVSGLKRLCIGVLNAPRWLVLGAVAAIAAGCGGGGGSASAGAAPQTVVTAPPTISGTPSTTAQVGVAYSFTPTASGASGAALTFSISNKPSWATFNSSTGNLAGTPGSSNVGTGSGIIIGVSNGTSSASLPAFSVTVAAAASNPATGSVTVSWVEPTTNTDGSAAAVTGYRLYYGTSSTALSQTIDINNPGQLSQLVGNLSAATWYFAVASVSSTGAESVLSNPVSAMVK